MVYISLYLVTAIVFLMLDVMMLKKVLYPLFSSNIGAIMNEYLDLQRLFTRGLWLIMIATLTLVLVITLHL